MYAQVKPASNDNFSMYVRREQTDLEDLDFSSDVDTATCTFYLSETILGLYSPPVFIFCIYNITSSFYSTYLLKSR